MSRGAITTVHSKSDSLLFARVSRSISHIRISFTNSVISLKQTQHTKSTHASSYDKVPRSAIIATKVCYYIVSAVSYPFYLASVLCEVELHARVSLCV